MNSGCTQHMVNDLSLLCNARLKSKHFSLDKISGCVPDFSFEFERYGIIYEPGEALYGSKLTVKNHVFISTGQVLLLYSIKNSVRTAMSTVNAKIVELVGQLNDNLSFCNLNIQDYPDRISDQE